jgi:DNA-binding response OmpR family regulator
MKPGDSGPQHAHSQRTALVVDDDEDARTIVCSALEVMDFISLQAADGATALRLFDECSPDLVILDYMMPFMSGVEVCARIKSEERGKLVPVIMLTALDDVRNKVSALEGGADDYLTKPFHYQELQARIRAQLRVRDLNQQLHIANQELLRMQERLVATERQLAVGQLAGTAAHELGQPLAAMLLNFHLLELLPKSDERFSRALEAVKNDARRMAGMLERLKLAQADKTSEYYDGSKIISLAEQSEKQ